ncbi:MAG: aminoacyl-tRNA hydrolase [Hyphomicrobiales bacterium]|nr:aminoacyl-tRNA hydrolase [Hyphomicrobiales bacterium]PCJ89639.1 MAG: aminoacyl-tRNA hydrolase [Hyphomicrobiales bacterium]
MKLIVGLGNPGAQYAYNRHNIGFLVADEIHARHGFTPWRSRFQGLVSSGTIAGDKVTLVKPNTYMNESGRSAGEAARFFKIPLSDTIVFYDELDLAPGKVRVKVGGGAGGHNGIRSLDAHIGNEFQRVRIGIGHPGHKGQVSRHVLSDFAKVDAEWLDPLINSLAIELPILLKDGASSYMNKVALALKPNTKEPKKAKQPGAKPVQNSKPTTPSSTDNNPGPMAAALKALLSITKKD